jgi:quinol monooxygenase YgiN
MPQSITRVVKLTLHPEHIEAFKKIFASHKMHIAQFEGCIELNAYQDNKQPEVFFTISRWQSEQHLDNYRYSDFFKSLWSVVKPMFAAKAAAYSMTVV